MKLTYRILLAAMILTLFSLPALASDTVRQCPQADGTSLYTNKDTQGCTVMALKELSIVSSLDNMPIIPQQPLHFAVTETPKNTEVCSLFREYTQLVQATGGGVHYQRIEDNQRYIALLRLFGGGFVPRACQ